MLRHFWSYLVYFMFKKIFLWLVWLNISYKQSFFFFLYQYSKFFSHFRNISCICFTAQESFSLGIYCCFFFSESWMRCSCFSCKCSIVAVVKQIARFALHWFWRPSWFGLWLVHSEHWNSFLYCIMASSTVNANWFYFIFLFKLELAGKCLLLT